MQNQSLCVRQRDVQRKKADPYGQESVMWIKWMQQNSQSLIFISRKSKSFNKQVKHSYEYTYFWLSVIQYYSKLDAKQSAFTDHMQPYRQLFLIQHLMHVCA